jgi:hypothetical protein
MKGIVTFLFLFLSGLSFGQEVRKEDPQVLPILIDERLLSKFFVEVHQGSEYVYDSERERIYKEQLSRIEIIYIPYVENIHHPKLSTIEKMTKYNQNINFDLSNFNPNNFNFIKYGFNFYSSSDQFIRVDNQDYIIHILPYIKK